MSHTPERSELWFRFCFSLAGLVLVIVAVVVRGISQGPALFEVIGIAGLFFAASAFWSGRKLFGRRSDDR